MSRVGVLALACLLLAAPAPAQDSKAVPAAASDSAAAALAPPRAPDSVPTIRPPVSPMGAFWRSLALPGWGQAELGRRSAGAFFLAFEGVALGMTLTTSSQLGRARTCACRPPARPPSRPRPWPARTGSPSGRSKDPAIPGGFWLWAVADNLTVGSALNADGIARALVGEA